MNIILAPLWGIILTILSSIGYFGQVITAFWPDTASRLGLTEPESEVDPAFYADVRGEVFWDMLILWTLPVAGILLILNCPLWPYFGLVGGGMYLYFAGRGIAVRRAMQQRGIRIGTDETLKVAYVFLTLWGLAAVITIVMAIVALP
ncbi:MAG: hypothetical protein ISR58_12725 [Anaerolineales bacterium]|nr:hypothetical protein [Chloroflexota bacterium]MBL6982043.1 hypothetical protein [Anaerolineales bacterium]